MKTRDVIAGIAIGGGILWLATSLIRAQSNQGPPRVYPPPPARNNTAEWQSWVSLVLSLTTDIASLWEPDGPFYGLKEEDVYDVVDPGDLSNVA